MYEFTVITSLRHEQRKLVGLLDELLTDALLSATRLTRFDLPAPTQLTQLTRFATFHPRTALRQHQTRSPTDPREACNHRILISCPVQCLALDQSGRVPLRHVLRRPRPPRLESRCNLRRRRPP